MIGVVVNPFQSPYYLLIVLGGNTWSFTSYLIALIDLIHIERECLDVLLLLSLAVLQNKQKIFLFLYYSNLGAVAADLLYKSVLGLCLIISRAARYLPKLALSNLPSVCVYNDLYGWSIQRPLIYLHSRYNQGLRWDWKQSTLCKYNIEKGFMSESNKKKAWF